jgi:hypothetical protein
MHGRPAQIACAATALWKNVLVIEDDAVGGSDVLAHRLVIGVHDDVREAALLDVGRDLIEVLRLVAGARAREHDDAVARRCRDDLREALALEEETRGHEDELVHRKAEPLAQRALLGVVLRHRGVLERNEHERETLELS